MASTNRITLPVSALKTEATRVFDALAAGRTVYVSKHGKVVAAFRPYVPMEVAATYVLPLVTTAEVTARSMQQAAPTRAVHDAESGLPSLVTRDRKVYGVLVSAELPATSVEVSDIDAAGARSEAMNAFLTSHPNASIEDVVRYREELDAQIATTPPVEGLDDDAAIEVATSSDEIAAIREQWRERGSIVEGVVEALFAEGLAAGAMRIRSNVTDLLSREGGRGKVVSRDLPAHDSVSSWVAIRQAATVVDKDPVAARHLYVTALADDPNLRRGVMWRLGDLSRAEGYTPEATTWYTLALGSRSEHETRPQHVLAAGHSPSTTPGRKVVVKRTAAAKSAARSAARARSEAKKAAAKTGVKKAAEHARPVVSEPLHS